MADWDADGSRLRGNLERMLADISQWADKREKFTVAIIKRWHMQTMAGLDVPVPEFVGRFRGEYGLENEPVHIGLNKGTNAARVVAEADTLVARIQAVLGRLDELVSPGEKLDRDRLEAIIEFAAWAHSEWVRIHPFCNSNGRIARVLTNAIFLRYGLPPVPRLRPRPSSPYSYAGAQRA